MKRSPVFLLIAILAGIILLFGLIMTLKPSVTDSSISSSSVQIKMLIVATPTPNSTPTPLPTPTPFFITLVPLEEELYNYINAERAKAGLPPLVIDPHLQALARERSYDMAAHGYFSHRTLQGNSVFDLMAEHGIPFGWAGENLTRNNYPDSQSVEVAIRDLMASSPHRANILHDHYTIVGVGLATDGFGMKYFTMIFVGPA